MHQLTLEIAGVTLSFESRRLTLARELLPFLTCKSPQLYVRQLFSDPPSFSGKKLCYQRGNTYRFYRTGGGFLVEINPSAVEKELRRARPLDTFLDGIPKAFFLDASLKEAFFFLGADKKKSFHLIWPFVYLLISHLFSYRRSGIFVHAAGICYKGRGYLFVGPSGAGKSTLARLFSRERNTTVLGDDIIAVCSGQKGPSLYGTPIFSTLRYFPSKKKAPLQAIFFLRHGRVNGLGALYPREALRYFLSETPPILWVPESFSFSAEFILDLCTKLPTYELSFLPDESAVSFVKNSFSRLK